MSGIGRILNPSRISALPPPRPRRKQKTVANQSITEATRNAHADLTLLNQMAISDRSQTSLPSKEQMFR
jgi:hypothetical protein